MISVREAKRAGLFGKQALLPNIVAGTVVGVVALLLSMAFAIASGTRPEQGLHIAMLGGLMVSVQGSSRVQIAGPTGAFIAILSGVTVKYGMPAADLHADGGLHAGPDRDGPDGGVIKFRSCLENQIARKSSAFA